MDLLTNSRMNTFQRCRRLHQFQYLQAIRKLPNEALRIGSAVHLGLDMLKSGAELTVVVAAIRKNYVPLMEFDGIAVECETCIALVCGWAWRWSEAAIEVVQTELSFSLPIVNPDTGASTPSFGFAGKIDGIIKLEDGRLAILEHKTTSEDLSPDSDYWKVLRLDAQITRYMLAARLLGHEVLTVLYDAIRKPGIRPKMVNDVDSDGLRIVVDGLGMRARNRNGTFKQSGDKAKGLTLSQHLETPEEYGERLLGEIYESPDRYFARQEVPRLESDLEEMRHEIWQIQRDMREAEKHGRHFRNTDSCKGRMRCDFLDVCHGTKTFDGDVPPEGFVRVPNIHPELELENDVDCATTPAGADCETASV